MKTTGNEPYFININSDDYGGVYTLDKGITIRQEFAKAAMAGIISKEGMILNGEYIAKYAVNYADALIAELNKTEK